MCVRGVVVSEVYCLPRGVDLMVEAADGSVASGFVRCVYPAGHVQAYYLARKNLCLWRWHRRPGSCAPHVAPRRARPAARSRTQIRRSLYGWYPGGRAGLRLPTCSPSCLRKASKPRNGRGRDGCCATSAAASASSIRASAPVATLHITTTSTAVSTPFSWMPTGNTAAPISKRRTPRSTTRSSPRNGISPRS